MPKYTKEEARKLLIDKVHKAIYPVLIPIEQQDIRIQAENSAHVRKCAEAAVNLFLGD